MQKGMLYTGWAHGDITPKGKTLVQGQFHARLTDTAISPLTATALAIETRDQNRSLEQAVFLSCDLPGDDCKAEILAKLEGRCPGLDLSKITISATHTHNAPPVRSGLYEEPQGDPTFSPPPVYRAFLIEQLASIVESAWQNLTPGSVSRGFGYAVVGRCRRATYRGDKAEMYGNADREDFMGMESCDDHAVNMLFFYNQSEELAGILINLACPSQCDERKNEISADFWHNVREEVQERFGPNVRVLAQCAPAGDKSPHLMLDKREECDLRNRMQLDDKGIITRRIMAAIEEALKFASPRQSEMEFKHQVATFDLPRLQVTKEEYEIEKRIPSMSKEELAKQPWGFDKIWPFGPVCHIVGRYEQQGPDVKHRIECHFIRLGDVAFASNPFELFVDYGTQIRARSKALQTFLVQLGDDSCNGFYLPTQRALDAGHYSALIKSNWVGPEGGAILVKATVDRINQLFSDADYPVTR